MATIIINTRGSIADEIAAAGIELICNEDMNFVISDKDLARLRTEFPTAYDDIYLVQNDRVDDVECSRDGHQGITLSYTIDGKPYEITGEFFIDKAGVLHHSAADPADPTKEIEITYQYI